MLQALYKHFLRVCLCARETTLEGKIQPVLEET